MPADKLASNVERRPLIFEPLDGGPADTTSGDRGLSLQAPRKRLALFAAGVSEGSGRQYGRIAAIERQGGIDPACDLSLSARLVVDAPPLAASWLKARPR